MGAGNADGDRAQSIGTSYDCFLVSNFYSLELELRAENLMGCVA